MKIYRLRDKDTGKFYKGSGKFDTKGKIYTSIGHIKNSLGQTWGGKFPKSTRYEIVTYELTEIESNICV